MNFQNSVTKFVSACFGNRIAADKVERNHRFLEEALELVQSCGCTASEAHQLVDYVFNRPVGETEQEVGGVMVTLAALCTANNEGFLSAGWIELDRCWKNKDAIRDKQANKPKHSPLAEKPVELLDGIEAMKLAVDRLEKQLWIAAEAIDEKQVNNPRQEMLDRLSTDDWIEPN